MRRRSFSNRRRSERGKGSARGCLLSRGNIRARKFLNQQARGDEGFALCGSECAHLLHEKRATELLTLAQDGICPGSIHWTPARAAFPAEDNPIGFQVEATHADWPDGGFAADPEWSVLPSWRAAKLTQDAPTRVIRIAGSRQLRQAIHSHAGSVQEGAACTDGAVW